MTVCYFRDVSSSSITSLSRDLTALFSIQAVMPMIWIPIFRAVIVPDWLHSVLFRDEHRDVHDVP